MNKIKVKVKIMSLKYLLLVLNGLMLADGIWHYTSDAEEGMKHWPDWVIARQFRKTGMPVWFHRAIGIFLIAGSLLLAISLRNKSKNCYAVVFKNLVIPVTTIAILASVAVSSNYEVVTFITSVLEGAVKQVLIPTMILSLISEKLI